jgi:hypothetical protein
VTWDPQKEPGKFIEDADLLVIDFHFDTHTLTVMGKFRDYGYTTMHAFTVPLMSTPEVRFAWLAFKSALCKEAERQRDEAAL